jgi:hypothetical protein
MTESGQLPFPGKFTKRTLRSRTLWRILGPSGGSLFQRDSMLLLFRIRFVLTTL